MIGKGFAFILKNEYVKALRIFEEIIIERPRNDIALTGRGFALNRLQAYTDAYKSFTEAIIKNNENDVARIGRAFSLIWQEKYKKAINEFEEIIQKNKKSEVAWFGKAIALNKDHEYEKAQKAYRETIELYPDNTFVRNYFANFYLKLGNLENAATLINEVLKREPNNSGALALSGRIRTEQRKYNEAIGLFDKSIQNRPGDPSPLLWKAYTRYLREEYSSAIKYEKDGEELVSAIKELEKLMDKYSLEIKSKKSNEELVSVIRELERADNFLRDRKIKSKMKRTDKKILQILRVWYHLILNKIIYIIYRVWEFFERRFDKRDLYNKSEESDNELKISKLEREKIQESTNPQKIKKKLVEYNCLRYQNEYKSKKKEEDNQIRARILYLLACFYYKIEDFFTAKDKLRECIKLKSGADVESSAKDLLAYVWGYQIRPPWWRWWLYSPYPKFTTFIMKIIFTLLIISIIFLLVAHPWISRLVTSEIEGSMTTYVEWTIYTLLIFFLIFVLLSPCIERLKGKEYEIEMQSPPSISFEINPSMFERIIQFSEKSPGILELLIKEIVKDIKPNS